MATTSERKTATALLTSEAAMLERMRRAVDRIIADHFTTTPGREAIVAKVNQAADALRRHLPAVIAAGRTDARNAGLRALHADADRLRKELRRIGESDALPELPALSDSQAADARSARSSALAFAGAWQTAATSALVAAASEGARLNAKRIMREAAEAAAHHIDRIVATENADAFNDERTIAAQAIARAAGLHLRRQWSAKLDARTCETCERLDSEVRWDHEPFDRGLSAPPLHPHCRCFVVESWHRTKGTA